MHYTRLTVDLTGQTYNWLYVCGYSHQGKYGRHWWACECLRCGNATIAQTSDLHTGKKKSCGCLHLETARTNGFRNATHHHSCLNSSTYRSWCAMIQRCTNPHNNRYHLYGGRGITICSKWRESFEAFLEDMGERPPNMTLDRINPNGNYEPGNCRWATYSQQARNKRK